MVILRDIKHDHGRKAVNAAGNVEQASSSRERGVWVEGEEEKRSERGQAVSRGQDPERTLSSSKHLLLGLPKSLWGYRVVYPGRQAAEVQISSGNWESVGF